MYWLNRATVTLYKYSYVGKAGVVNDGDKSKPVSRPWHVRCVVGRSAVVTLHGACRLRCPRHLSILSE